MKFKDLIKADWPEKRNASSYDSDSEISLLQNLTLGSPRR